MTKDEQFTQNITKLIAAELYFVATLYASHEMYGKSYFSLGVSEKQAIDQTVWSQIFGNFQQLTPELLGAQSQAKTGFQPPDNQPTSS